MALESPGQNIEYILFVLCGRRDVGANPDKARGSPYHIKNLVSSGQKLIIWRGTPPLNSYPKTKKEAPFGASP